MFSGNGGDDCVWEKEPATDGGSHTHTIDSSGCCADSANTNRYIYSHRGQNTKSKTNAAISLTAKNSGGDAQLSLPITLSSGDSTPNRT
jgi:hypothetical protein